MSVASSTSLKQSPKDAIRQLVAMAVSVQTVVQNDAAHDACQRAFQSGSKIKTITWSALLYRRPCDLLSRNHAGNSIT